MTNKTIELKDFGEVLTTREQGVQLRAILLNFYTEVDTEKIVIDFKEIRLISHGFVDEFLGKLVEEPDHSFVTHKIGFKNLGDHKRIVNYVINDRWKVTD
jgi:hypothetical protein